MHKLLALFVLANALMAGASALLLANVFPGTTAVRATPGEEKIGVEAGIALIGAAIAVAGSTLAAGIALSAVAKAGFAAYVERPEVATWLLILGGLAEGIAIYGLLVAIMILGKI